MVGAWRARRVFWAPTEVSVRASQPKEGLWQDEQVMFSAPDSRGSKNSALPSAAFSGVYGLLAGKGISVGRL